jgi:6-phosphofructokinase
LASLFAEKAVDLICNGEGNKGVGLQNGQIVGFDLSAAATKKKSIDIELLNLAEKLAI